MLLERSTNLNGEPKIMRKAAQVCTILSLFVYPLFVIGQGAPTPSVETKPPQKFVIEVEVPATLSAVWNAFTTSDGLSTWLGPNATVDLRPGGDWLVHFPNGKTGGGSVISYTAQKEIVLSALAPDQFPHVRAERTTATFDFEPRGNSTLVRLTQTGWKSGQEWTHAYEYLVAGNAQLLAILHKRFAEGPVDWKKMFAPDQQ
jgi:uncharacterized protein YndB with AHSA1/START domain